VDAIDRGLACLLRSQTTAGSLRREYDGPLFLLPGYVFARYAVGAPMPNERRRKLREYVLRTQNADGGFGLHVEGESILFTTVLNYVTLRLLGASSEDAPATAALAWIRDRGGARAIPSWGKYWLAVLRLYEWEGVNPLPPELWLLPRWFPVHPRRFWCHARVIHLAVSYLYGRRWQTPDSPLLAELRRDLYAQTSYEETDFRRARNLVAPDDLFTPHTRLLRVLNGMLAALEPHIPRRLRRRALEHVVDHVKHEDTTTDFLDIGPVNKALNVVVAHAAGAGDEHLRRALERLDDYLFEGETGLTMQAYNSSELWDTAFASQAIAASGRVDRHRRLADAAFRFVDENQVRENLPDGKQYHRGPARGGWPFSTRPHGWPIADCTAEGLLALLALGEHVGGDLDQSRLLDAVDLLLELQNPDGGWPTYERIRGRPWLERLNSSELFADIMVDYSYTESTSSVLCGLAEGHARFELGELRAHRVARALVRGERYLRSRQRADGSWEGAWGICFTYGTWFGIRGLRGVGAARDDSALERAAAFLCSRQLPDGGWGESYQSCLRRQYVRHPEGGQPVMTAWALLALLETEAPGAGEAVERGVRFLLERQRPDGDWPQRSVTGVFNRTCMLNYACYRTIFPVWALGVAAQRGFAI
jgi:squalene/oxidosqualene cyclase-like protein